MEKQKISALAKVIRSKNAGPFRTTLDLFFDDREAYEKVKDSGVLTREAVAKLYRQPVERVEGVYFVDSALGIKITLVKEYPSDNFLGRDCYGAQQHVPLLEIEI